VGAVAVALFTWLPSGNTATSDGGTLNEALERAHSQVATLLGADSDTASAEEADSEASEPGGLLGILAGAVLPDREEERSDDPPTPQPSNDKADNETSSSNNQRTNETSEPNPVTLAPREAVPTVTEGPPVSAEEPAAIPAAPAPLVAPAPEPAPLVAPEPEPAPLVAPEPEPAPLVAPEPEPAPLAPSPQTPPPDTSPDVPEDPNAPPSISCKSVPGDEPGSTVTRCG
jgi:DNA polymerase-3 subunit gamma/tau